MKFLKQLWEEKPLRLILFSALFFRLLAVIFSKGFGMHDDHFLIIEAAQSWVDGDDYNNWLPSAADPNRQPQGHSLFYVGIIYYILYFLQWLGLTDPQAKMYVIRLLHALFSVLIVYYAYKIAEKKAGVKAARQTGIVLALFWMLPFLSVRNLIEVVCIPPLLAATWMIIKHEKEIGIKHYIYAGILLGLAFSVRFQTIMFTGGFGLALLFTRQYKGAILTGLFFLLMLVAIQGGIDYFIWHRPFAEFQEYVNYNINNAGAYPNGPWYMYLSFLGGVLIPPVSLFLFFGFFRLSLKHLLLFLPAFFFIVFHSYFPNKQERFILPALPSLVTLGFMGWQGFYERSAFWQKRKKLYTGCWVFFWTMNTIALLFISVSYSKRNRVESMCYLAAKGDVVNLIIEDSNRNDSQMIPRFYLQKWIHPFEVTKQDCAGHNFQRYQSVSPGERPNYVVFFQAENIETRIDSMKHYFPNMKYETTIDPSAVDKLMHFLNPEGNENHTTYIYKIGD